MTSFAQQLRSRLFGGVLGGSSKATAAAGVDLSRKTKPNSSTAHLDTEKNPYSFGTVQYPDDLGTAARVAGDATNNRAEVRMTPVDVTNRRFSFTFTYRVL